MKRILLALGLVLWAGSASASCQQGSLAGYFAANTLGCTQAPIIGANLLGGGSVALEAATAGRVTFNVAASVTSYTFQVPSAAGTTGQPLLYGTPHTYGTLSVGGGGSGATTLTGILLGNGTSAFTGITTSAGIAGAISDETGSGALVFGTSPTFTTSILGGSTPFTWTCGSSVTQDCRINITSGAGAGSEKFTILGRSNGASTLFDLRSTATGAYARIGGAGGAGVGVDTELTLATSNAAGTLAIPMQVGGTLVGYFAANNNSLQLIGQTGISVSLSANATIILAGNSAGTNVNFPVATTSTSPTTGTATFGGGVGVSGDVWASGNHSVSVAAKTLMLKQGANGAVGTFVCTSGGTITINNTNVAITDAIIISLNAVGGTISTNPTVNAITAATSFTAKCATSDTSTYNYAIIKNAA